MANDRKPQEDDLVAKLVPDPSQGPPDATVLTGYLGRAPEASGKGKAASWRLYQSAALDEYVEIAEADILHTQKLPDEQGTLVWVPKSLPLNYVRVQSAQVQAELLGGAIAKSRLTATPGRLAGGRTEPSLGIACSTTTCPSRLTCVSQAPCPSVACHSFTIPCATQPGMCMSSTPSQCTLCPTPSATPSHCTHCPPPRITAVSQCGFCPTPHSTPGHCPSHVVCESMIVTHCTFCPTPVPTRPPLCPPPAAIESVTVCPPGPITFGCPIHEPGDETDE